MDMSTRRDDDPGDEFEFHRKLVGAIVKVCCLTSLAHNDGSQEAHRIDMMLLMDMISAELLCHAYPDLDRARLMKTLEAHLVHVIELYADRRARP